MHHLLARAAAFHLTSSASTVSRVMRTAFSVSCSALGWGSGKGGSQRGGGDASSRRQGGGERGTTRPRSPRPPPPAPSPRRDASPPLPRPRAPFPAPSSSSSSSFAFDHTGRFFATCHPGLEPFVADELLSPAIGASAVEQGRGGVHFRGSAATCYAANLWLRTAIRVLHLVGEGSIAPSRYRGVGGGSGGSFGNGGRAGGVRGGDRLYALTRRAVDWASLLPSSPSSSSSPGTISVDARVGACTDLAGSKLALTIVRDAICDAIRDATGSRPPPPDPFSSPSSAPADLPVFVAAHRDVVQLYRDTSGDSLHRRGYRTGSKVHAAALNEAAAAGVLAAAGWPKRVAAAEREFISSGSLSSSSSSSSSSGVLSLVDPMCGSGTLLIEAALAATHTAPGLSRTRWPFLRWRDFDQGLWRSVREGAAAASRRDGVTTTTRGVGSIRSKRLFYLAGRDCHEGALALAQRGAYEAGVDHLIDFDLGKCADWRPAVGPSGERPTLVVTNPPWGRRLMGARDRFDAPAFAPRARGGDDRRHRRAAVNDDGESVRPWYDEAAAADGDGLGWDSPPSDESNQSSPSSPSNEDDPELSEEALAAAWKDLGTFLRDAASPGEAFVVCGNPAASRGLRMRAARKLPLTAGGADVRILKYEVLPPLAGGGGEGKEKRPEAAAAK